MRVNVLRLGATVLASVVVTASCTHDSTQGPSSPPAESTESAMPQEPEKEPTPREQMKEAVRTIREDNTGTFATQVYVGEELLVDLYGTYQLSPIAFTTSVDSYADFGAVTYRSQTVAIGGQMWIRSVNPMDESERRCWVHLNEAFDRATNVNLAGAGNLFPLPVGVALAGRGRSSEGIGSIDGTSDLFMTMSIPGPQLPRAFGLTVKDRARTPVTFDIDNGRLSRWSASLSSVVKSARDAGFELKSDDDPIVAKLLRRHVTIDAQLTDATIEVDVRPPPRKDVVEFVEDPDELDAAMRVCMAGTVGA